MQKDKVIELNHYDTPIEKIKIIYSNTNDVEIIVSKIKITKEVLKKYFKTLDIIIVKGYNFENRLPYYIYRKK
ncbi:hypothetical protein [Tenacibaculum sp. C7A-26P2]|uniref:hypothetical protein n=1 Tax=Tenacibaculum sp. C7A-26P2 TaxID=3447504 RepID=UPI003F8771F8